MLRLSNVHDRRLRCSSGALGHLLMTLATPDDVLWPHDVWPPIELEDGLKEGSIGGHGPIRYRVAQVHDQRLVRFSFLRPSGLTGDHWFEVISMSPSESVLRHGLVGTISGPMRWQWPLLYRPLHNALVEDALDRAELAIAGTKLSRHWSPRVRILRRLTGRRHRRRQI